MKSEGEKLLIRLQRALEAGELPSEDDRATFCNAVDRMAKEQSREDAEYMLLYHLDFKRKGGRPAYGGLEEMHKFGIVLFYETQVRERKKRPRRFRSHGGLAAVRKETAAKYGITEHMLIDYRKQYGAYVRNHLDNGDGKITLGAGELRELAKLGLNKK